ncbi:MAG: hypothetical protein PHR68_00100 [Candidatus Gracilibacteria bacterium]|nr:hypothetical protein [Candidatus Gracilibacteria bacterium]
MKKLVFILLVSIALLNSANALKIDEKYQTMCNEVGGELVTHTSYANCSINKKEIFLDSLKDKYAKYISGIMIKYASEYKYSSKDKWKNYLEFFAKDIEDLKIFSEGKLSKETKEKINSDIKIQEDLYEFMSLKSKIGEKNASRLDKEFQEMEAKIQEKDLKNFYENLKEIISKKIISMEYQLTITRFTEDGYKKFILRLNAYKYLEKIIEGRME